MAISIMIKWLDGVPERAREILNAPPTFSSSWWDGQYLPGLGVAEEGLEAIFQVSDGGNRLFDRPGVEGRDLAVPYTLWQMERAIQIAAAEGGATFVCAPLSEYDIWVRVVSGLICIKSRSAYDGGPVCAPAEDWRAALAIADEECRDWILRHIPELADDDVLGLWLRGGGPPGFLPLAGEWDDTTDEAKYMISLCEATIRRSAGPDA